MQESAIRRMGTSSRRSATSSRSHPAIPLPKRSRGRNFRRSPASCSPDATAPCSSTGRRAGIRPLLEAIAGIMGQRGVATDLERLLITTGSQQGLDLVARVLLDPGDVVLVELPTYTGAITAFRNVQAEMVGVRQEADGIDLDGSRGGRMPRLTRDGRRVRVLYVVPNFQNPTGLLIGLQKRRAAARVGGAPRHADRRGRSVPRAVFRGFGRPKPTSARSRRTTTRGGSST